MKENNQNERKKAFVVIFLLSKFLHIVENKKDDKFIDRFCF